MEDFEETEEIEFKFDTQLLIEGRGLSEEKISDYVTKNIEGDCLLCVGDEELIKIHFHTNTPGKLVDFCTTQGDVFDVVIENMVRQTAGLEG